MKDTKQTAELLAKECTKAIRYSVTSDHPETILNHIPLVELLNVVTEVEVLLEDDYLQHSAKGHGIKMALTALRAKLPKES